MSRDRVSQRDVRPQAIKFVASQYYDQKNNTIDFKDDLGNSAFKIELANGTITFGTNVKFDAAITKGVSPYSFVPETIIPLCSGGSSGGGIISFYTDSATYVSIDSSRFTINAAEYPACSFYLETVYRAGASGDPARTFYAEIYDLTTGASVTNSEISGTTQSGATPGSLPIVRGTTNFRENMYSGSHDYVVRYKTSNAGSFVDLSAARLVIRFV